MGNSESSDNQGGGGGGGGGTSTRGIKALATDTPFTPKEIQQLLKRYEAYDKSPNGQDGISLQDCLTMTEFTGNKFVASILEANLDKETQRIHPEGFIRVLGVLSSKTDVDAKKEYVFQLLDVYGTGVLTHDEMFRVYKILLGGAVTDSHILSLAARALEHEDLGNPGEMDSDEFSRMIPDSEIRSRLTVDFLPGK